MTREVMIRECRERRGMTLEQLAAAAGVERRVLADLEPGNRCPSLDTALELAEALGVSVEGLYSRRGRMA